MNEVWIRRINGLQLFIVGVIILIPIYWMVGSSFKPPADVTAYPPKFIFEPTLANYHDLFSTTPFFRYLLNSIIVAGGSTLLGLALGMPAAFVVSWSRVNWPAVLVLAARMAPGMIFLLPWYMMFREVGLIGSHISMVLAYSVITLPIAIWVLLPFFDQVPRSILEAAQVDGCNTLRVLWRVAIPMVMPGIVVTTILCFVFSWNYFLFALILSNGETKTLIAASFNFIGEGATNWGTLMAAATMIALPPLVLAGLMQRWLVSGLVVGAVKG